MNRPLATVVIPTRNRPQAIVGCLDALAAQATPPGFFEVIVVDDGSEPALSLDPARWSSHFDLKLLHQKNTGPAGARNRGVAEAQGEFLAFTDDDCLPTPTWLERLTAALRERPESMIGGSTFNGLRNDLFAETSQIILQLVYEHFNHDPANAYFFASNNIAVRRELYLASGGFDSDFDSPAAEDREFCDRWRMQGRPLVWERSAVIEHRHDQNLAGFCRLHFRYGQGAFLYHAERRHRLSGTMVDDLTFHSTLPRAAWSRLSSYPIASRLSLAAALCLWQCANAAGFFHAMVSGFMRPSCAPRRRVG